MTDMPWAKLPRWIVLSGTLTKLTNSEAKILMILITLADQQGFASPSNRVIGELSGLGKQAISRATKRLTDLDCVTIHELASGRKPTVFHIDPTRKGFASNPSTESVEGSPITPLARRGVTSDRGYQRRGSRITPLQPVEGSPVTPLRTYIGTRGKEERRERENIYLSPLPDYAVELFRDSFPRGLIKVNWSDAAFDKLRAQIESQPMTSHWQVRRCIAKLEAVRDRKFAVPNPPEVYESLRAVEAANTIRSKFFERAVKNKLTTENLGQYRSIVAEMDATQLEELFAESLAYATGISPEAAQRVWDQSVPSLQRNAYSDLQIDPESNQYAARGLRCWVIQTSNAMQGESKRTSGGAA